MILLNPLESVSPDWGTKYFLSAIGESITPPEHLWVINRN